MASMKPTARTVHIENVWDLESMPEEWHRRMEKARIIQCPTCYIEHWADFVLPPERCKSRDNWQAIVEAQFPV